MTNININVGTDGLTSNTTVIESKIVLSFADILSMFTSALDIDTEGVTVVELTTRTQGGIQKLKDLGIINDLTFKIVKTSVVALGLPPGT